MKTKKHTLTLAAIAISAFAFNTAASAQEAAPKTASKGKDAQPVSVAAPQRHRVEEEAPAEAKQGESWLDRESLFIANLAEGIVADHGFTPSVIWAGEQWSNVGGGLQRGTVWDSLFDLGFELDLSKLAGGNGLGRIGMNAFYFTKSKDFGEYFSAMSDPSNIFSGDMVRVFEIYYANEFETKFGNFGFRVGQLAADEDFMGLDYADIFLNSSFGAIPAVAGMERAGGGVAFSQYSLATLGMTLSYSVDNFDVIFGLYNGNAGDDVSSNHGFDYELEDVAFWYQLGYNYELGGLNGRVAFGGNYHSGKFENYSTGDSSFNYYSFYLNLQQDFYADEEGNAVVGGFARFAYAPQSDVAVVSMYADAGINWFAPIPGRDNDVFAFGVSAMKTQGSYRTASGDYSTETCLETTYRCQLTGFMSIQPTFQVYFNPATDSAEKERDTAYVVGARLEVVF